MPDKSNDDAMAELFAKDADFAMLALNDALENGEPGELLIALRQMTKAFGGVQAVAERADLNPTQLYRSLSAEGNPTLSSLSSVLKAMGLQLAVRQIEQVKSGQPEAGKRPLKKTVRAQAGSRTKAAAIR